MNLQWETTNKTSTPHGKPQSFQTVSPDEPDEDGVVLFGDDELSAAIECFGPAHSEAAAARDPSGWTQWEFRTRQMAANWRCSIVRGQPHAFRHYRLGGCVQTNPQPFPSLSNEAVTAYLDGNVHAVDALHAATTRLCPLSVALELDGPSDGQAWFVVAGLSADGHLVGALSGTSQCKYW